MREGIFHQYSRNFSKELIRSSVRAIRFPRDRVKDEIFFEDRVGYREDERMSVCRSCEGERELIG